MTLLFIYFAIVIIWVYCRHKQDQILSLNINEMIQLHSKALRKYRNWTFFSLSLFILGIIMFNCGEIYETEEYEYWFFGSHNGTREVLTATGWWSYIFMIVGILIGFPCLMGLIDRYNAVNKYKKMSYVDYNNLQTKVQQRVNLQDNAVKGAKAIKTSMRVMDFLSKL